MSPLPPLLGELQCLIPKPNVTDAGVRVHSRFLLRTKDWLRQFVDSKV